MYACIYLEGGVTGRNRDRSSSAGHIPKWPQQTDLSQAEVRSQEFYPGLPGWSGRGPDS